MSNTVHSGKDAVNRDLKGSSAATPGLTPLDEIREGSLADEGGASAAVIESQDSEELRRLSEDLPVSHLVPCPDDEKGMVRLPVVALLILAAVTALASFALLRRSWS